MERGLITVIYPLLQRLAEPSALTPTVLLKAFGGGHASGIAAVSLGWVMGGMRERSGRQGWE